MHVFDEDLCDYYKSHDWNQRELDDIDTDLLRRAEICSDKWVQLYRCDATPKDENFTQILETTAIGGHHINRFNVHMSNGLQHLNSHTDSITERHKLILLDKKYFEFDASTSANDAPIDVMDPNERDNIDKYTTVFDHSNDQSEHDLEANSTSIGNQINDDIRQPQVAIRKTQEKSQTQTKTKSNKKKKGRTKYRPLTTDDAATTSAAANTRAANGLAAPPGVRVITPLTNPHRMDLTKNGNYSLQFRL